MPGLLRLLPLSLACLSPLDSLADCITGKAPYNGTSYPPTCYTLTFTSDTSNFTDEHMGFAYAADDAAAFIASNGHIRGAFLEQALRDRRQLGPVDEHEFAAAVLVYSTPR